MKISNTLIFSIVLATFSCTHAHDQDALNRKVATIQQREAYRKRIENLMVYSGGVVVVAAISYLAYEKFFPSAHVPTPIHITSDAVASSEISWVYEHTQWALKTSAGIIFQTVAFQAVQPFFVRLQDYFFSKVPLEVARFWFLREQANLVQGYTETVVNVTQELAEFVTALDTLELSYRNHEETFFNDAALSILSHTTAVAQDPAQNLYSRYTAEKVVAALTPLIDAMLNDLTLNIGDEQKILIFKDLVRRLRCIDVYSVIY